MTMEAQIREAFCEIGRRVWTRGFVASNDGNFSFRVGKNRILCTPTMISKGFMKHDDIIEVDLQGNQISGKRKLTSEIRLHLYIYQQRPDVYSVVHVHPPHATAFAIAGNVLPKCILPEVEVNLGQIPVAPYETTGTWKFAQTIAPWVHDHDCILLKNHGAVTMGRDPYDAYYKMETLDQYCRILLLAAQAGGWQSLSENAMHELMDLKKRVGIRDPRSSGELCSPEVSGRAYPRPAMPFVPPSGPITDEPKHILPKPSAAPKKESGPEEPDQVSAIVDEVIRRLKSQ